MASWRAWLRWLAPGWPWAEERTVVTTTSTSNLPSPQPAGATQEKAMPKPTVKGNKPKNPPPTKKPATTAKSTLANPAKNSPQSRVKIDR